MYMDLNIVDNFLSVLIIHFKKLSRKVQEIIVKQSKF